MGAETNEKNDVMENGTNVVASNESANADQLKKKRPKTILIVMLIVLAIVLGVGAFQMTPTNRAKRALAAGEKYLSKMEYEEAVASFKKALEIAPNEEFVKASVISGLEKMMADAEEAAGQKDYDKSIRISELVMNLGDEVGWSQHTVIVSAKENHERYVIGKAVSGIIQRADEEFEKGDFENAIKDYEDAKGKGADSRDIEPRLPMSRVFKDVIDAFAKGDYEKAAKALDSSDAGNLVGELDGSGRFYTGDGSTTIIKAGDAIVAVYGGLNASTSDGNAKAVISGANTYSFYDGEWKNYTPNGSGSLKVWNKRESFNDAAEIKGKFDTGITDGAEKYTRADVNEISVDTIKGAVKALDTDSQGNAVVALKDGKPAYGVKDAKVSNNVIDSYTAGVNGFGGSDEKLLIELLDSTPPVIKCSLKKATFERLPAWDGGTFLEPKSNYYDRKSIVGYGITAEDDVDGDLTDQIQYTQKRKASINGYNDNGEYGLEVEYTVSDQAGNVGHLTVEYLYVDWCEDIWCLVSME